MSQVTCPSCRTANEAGAVFCGNCGARMTPTAPQPAPQAPQFQSAPTPPPPPQYGAPQYQAPQYQAPQQPFQAAGYQQQPPVQPGYGAPGYPYGAQPVAGIPMGLVPAGFGIRLGAALIDAVLLWVINYVLTAVGAAALTYIVGPAFYIAFWALKGATPGKMALGLTIVSADGRPMDWGKAVIRYVGYLLSALILAIGFIMIAFDDQSRGLHDRIAKTYVVKKA